MTKYYCPFCGSEIKIYRDVEYFAGCVKEEACLAPHWFLGPHKDVQLIYDDLAQSQGVKKEIIIKA